METLTYTQGRDTVLHEKCGWSVTACCNRKYVAILSNLVNRGGGHIGHITSSIKIIQRLYIQLMNNAIVTFTCTL